MGLFGGKKKEMIPEVGSSGPPSSSSRGPPSIAPSQAPSYRSTAPSYVPPSQGGSGYNQQSSHWAQQGQQQQQPYGQPGQPSGGYAQYNPRPGGAGGRDNGSMRNELLSGAPKNAPPGGYLGGKQDPYAARAGGGGDQYGGGQQQPQQQQGEVNEEDEEVEGIKQQMRYVKQESLASTRNALRIAQEAEETARATLDKLGDQSDRIANTERHLDLAKAHNERAVDETKELEALNRSIFRPNMTWNKKAKRDKEEQRLINRHNQEKEEREQVRRDQYDSRQRIEGAYKGMDRDAENSAAARARARARGAERQRYQFEADEDDNAVEDEIDDNLDALGGVAGRLKMLAMASGAEVEAQNNKLSGLSGKVDRLDVKIGASTRKLAGIK